MTNRYWDAPIIFTRVGISLDTFLEVVEKYKTDFTRDQFAEVTKLKITSLRDKLRDLELYGFIKQIAKDKYVITDDGKSIIAGGVQRTTAIESAINRSPLWKQLILSIGKNPDRTLFDKIVRSIPSLSNIQQDFLDNLWSAYNADIACIKKSPPFASRQPVVRKLTLQLPASYAVKPAQIVHPRSNTQTDNNQQSSTSVDRDYESTKTAQTAPQKGEVVPEPGKVEYRGHVVVVTDDLTAKFAESLVNKMIKDLKRKGVEFDE